MLSNLTISIESFVSSPTLVFKRLYSPIEWLQCDHLGVKGMDEGRMEGGMEGGSEGGMAGRKGGREGERRQFPSS